MLLGLLAIMYAGVEKLTLVSKVIRMAGLTLVCDFSLT
jgi:hypothetical protein